MEAAGSPASRKEVFSFTSLQISPPSLSSTTFDAVVLRSHLRAASEQASTDLRVLLISPSRVNSLTRTISVAVEFAAYNAQKRILAFVSRNASVSASAHSPQQTLQLLSWQTETKTKPLFSQSFSSILLLKWLSGDLLVIVTDKAIFHLLATGSPALPFLLTSLRDLCLGTDL
jgi:hypothetical protein